MGEFDSKKKGSQVNVYQLIAERNSSTPSKQPSQPREVQPQQSFPQQPQAQPQPAEAKRRGLRVDSLVYFLLIFAILGGIYMRLGGAKDSLAKYEAGQPDIKHEEINNEYFADPDCARLYEVDDVQDTEYGGVEEHVAYTEAKQGDAELPDDVSDPSQVVIQADPIGRKFSDIILGIDI